MKKLFGIVLISLLMSGCGQSGKLYLPEKKTPPVQQEDNK